MVVQPKISGTSYPLKGIYKLRMTLDYDFNSKLSKIQRIQLQ